MPILTSFLIVCAASLFAVLVYMMMKLKAVGTPTCGHQINLEARPEKCLVVIDVQEDFTRNTGKNAFDPVARDGALERIADEIRTARSRDEHVVFITNVFRDWPVVLAMKLVTGGIGTPGRQGLRLDRMLDVAEGPVFEKSIGDSFSNSKFEDWLEQQNIGHLTLVGLDACHCVQLTAKGGRSRGFRVEILEAATLTTRPDKWAALKGPLRAAGVVV
ncbi:cysteine hydrolase family protein [Roseibium algae]|uniref:Cysteine hydrolase n=1 Tax=Roseibium algae TaxID=3123038 RepID=A0ABU8TH55_9HYPH